MADIEHDGWDSEGWECAVDPGRCHHPRCLACEPLWADDLGVERCNALGDCVLPKGHNMGRADVPENHLPWYESRRTPPPARGDG